MPSNTTPRSRTRTRATRPLLEGLESRLLLTSYTIASSTGLPGNNNGITRPESLVADTAGNVFGTTELGGDSNYGTIFEIPAGTNNVLTLATFNSTNGALPMGNLVLDASGNLFGATSGGGVNNRGTLWELKKNANHVTTLWNFTGNSGGAYPDNGVVADSTGNLWGTTFGDDTNFATVFRLNIRNDNLQTLATFTKNTHLNSTLATLPDGTLAIDSKGYVFGTIYNASGHGDGEIFQLGTRATTPGHPGNLGNLAIISAFNSGNNASLPVGTLLYLTTNTAKPVLVGITISGGSKGDGSIYEALLSTSNTPGASIRVLQNFTNTSNIGARPVGRLIATGTNGLYTLTGVTADGAANGNGGVYQISLSLRGTTHTATVPQQLSGTNTALTDALGDNPTGGLAIVPAGTSTGNIYITTANKGPFLNGSVVELSPTRSGSDRLLFATQPASAIAGQSFGSIVIRAITPAGGTDTSLNGTVTLSLAVATGPFGATITGGTTTVRYVNGIASFPASLVINRAGLLTLRAIDSHNQQAQSAQFTISPTTAAKLVVAQQPTSGSATRPLGAIVVNIEDRFGNVVNSDSSQVTLRVTRPVASRITNASVSANKGVATFTNATLFAAGTFTIAASDPGFTSIALAPITIGPIPTLALAALN